MTTPELDIHLASADELVDAHRNVHDIWSKGLAIEEHVQYRLNSPSHRRAAWFVGCVDGRVVCSAGCYPIDFRVQGHSLPSIALGSVYTRSEYRGRGYAPRLITWVEEYHQAHGKQCMVLYSDIDPNYYARMGYALCPSWQGTLREVGSATAGTGNLRWEKISPNEHLPRLMQTYAEYHGALPFSVARDEEYWRAMLLKFPDDAFYALRTPAGEWAGYVRVGTKAGAWRITDFALENHSEELASQMYAGLIELAASQGVRQIGGWLPKTAAAEKFFELAPRKQEITMIKPLAWAGKLSAEMIAGTTYFCEIDHV